MKINLSSTSFLLPKNKSWEHLSNLKDISFSEYGDIFSNMSKLKKAKKYDIEFFMIFLPDLLDYFDTKQDKNLEKKKIDNLILLIKSKIIKNNNRIVICISDFLYSNTINFSQAPQNSKQIKNYLINDLYDLAKKFKNLYIVDIDNIFSKDGLNNCFDQRNYYLCGCRLSILGIEILAKNLRKILNRIYFTNKKVLILDADNTLWGGIVAEDGINKIQIKEDGEGFAFFDFQRAIKKIKEDGVILVIVSKNNEMDVLSVFKKHKSMFLKEEDITNFKVNWNEKTDNIIKLSKELDLGLDSFVFWDDNPIEREKVRRNLKNVTVIEPDKDVSNWTKQLLEYEGFSKFVVTGSDKLKSKQYKIRGKFISDKSKSHNEFDYLKSINLKPKKININDSNLSRAIQLSQKTNQFNLRSIRYNSNDFAKIKKNKICFLVNLKDIYGDHGIIALIILEKINKDSLFIDTFLMSCRVLGRYLESWILGEIKKIALNKRFKNIIIEYIPSKRNQIVEKFLKSSKSKEIERYKIQELFKKHKNYFSNKKSKFYILKTSEKLKNLKIYE